MGLLQVLRGKLQLEALQMAVPPTQILRQKIGASDLLLYGHTY